MSNLTILQSIKEARRDALVNNYIANNIPRKFENRIKDENTLYEYLLLDTKIGNLVKTSPIAEAISSLQLYIHRCVEGMEGSLTDKANSYFRKGKFLDDWEVFNRRYSTWSGKERLKYYAGSYIDPSLRSDKTEIFITLEQSINQGRITNDSVKNTFKNYLTEYTNLSNLEYINVNKGEDESRLFFVGRTKTIPFEYYWRSLELKMDNNKNLIPDVWSEWKKINASIGEALDDNVMPFWEDNRLHMRWFSKENSQGETSQLIEEKYYFNCWMLDSRGIWNQINKIDVAEYKFYTMSDIVATFEIINVSTRISQYEIITNNNSLHCTTHGLNLTITMKKNIMSIFYKSAPNYNYLDRKAGLFNGSNFDNDFLIGHIELDQTRVFRTQFNKVYRLEEVNSTNGNQVSGPWLTFKYKFKIIRHSGFGSIVNNKFSPPAGSKIKQPINLTLKNNIDLDVLFEKGIDLLYDYNVQEVQLGGMDAFYGHLGIYIWEIFFHIPFLFASRFQIEQRYQLADTWLKYIFDSTSYRDEDGNFKKDKLGNIRYFNVLPLQEDTEWNDTLSITTTDAHRIAMLDPMHYKLAIFIKTLDLLISRGDNLYRMLERDTMTEAKMFYIQASQLLGPRSEIKINSSWPNPTLEDESKLMTFNKIESQNEIDFIEILNLFLNSQNGNFLPPHNEDFLNLWDKIEIRLYNLRNNLNLDGQPLYLPLFSEPVNPREIQARHITGDDISEGDNFSKKHTSVYRFPVVIEKARSVVNSVIQFGNSLENALEKQDANAMTALLQSQQHIILQQTGEIQEKNLEAIQKNLESAIITKSEAESNLAYFTGLVENWMSDEEVKALELRTYATITAPTSIIPTSIASFADTVPNVFGLATGGSRWGAISNALAQGILLTSSTMDQKANIMEISESYRRRREEWILQMENAESEILQLEKTISSLEAQVEVAKKQIVLTETEQAHIEAVYELQKTKFTSQNLYNWMVGRLSSLYFQMYDIALSLCFIAKNSLERELGNNKTSQIFNIPSWNNLYQGLLAGEMLMPELQKLDSIWLEENKRGMEAIKNVSLDNIITQKNSDINFKNMLKVVLNGHKPDSVNGVAMQLQNNIFSATLDLSNIGLENSYNQIQKERFIKNISVSLPTLLGPYQNIEATLSLGDETVTLSHGMDDSGLFIIDLNDSRFLPFEGMNPSSGVLTISIFNTNEDGEQRFLLENLNDIIFHIRYVIK